MRISRCSVNQAPILSSGHLETRRPLAEQPEDGSDELTLERSDRPPAGLLLGPLAGEIGLGRGVMGGLDGGDRVERPVELPIAAPVEAHPADLPRARRDRRHAGKGGEGVGRSEAADVARLGDQLGGGEDTRARHVEERMGTDEPGDLGRERAFSPRADPDAAGRVGFGRPVFSTDAQAVRLTAPQACFEAEAEAAGHHDVEQPSVRRHEWTRGVRWRRPPELPVRLGPPSPPATGL